MKSSYTPGPWTAHWGEIQDNAEFRIYAMHTKEFKNRPLAFVRSCGNDFSHANVNLIAAAPDMLAALQSAENLLLHASAQIAFKSWEPVYAEIQLAIAKAEGKIK